MNKLKIRDYLPLVDGLWYHIDYQFPEIFDIDSSQLDILFLSNWSMRTAAPIMHVLHTEDGTQFTSEELENLAGIVNGMYKHKWDKLMAVAEIEYDPIHNYSDSMIETIEYSEEVDGTKSVTGSHSDTRTDNLTKTETDLRTYTDTYNVTDTETDNKTKQETRNLSNTGTNASEDGIFGFNSSTSVGDSDTSGSTSNLESGTITETRTGTETNVKTGTEGRTHGGTLTDQNTGTQTNAGSNSSSETSGNDTTGDKTREYTKTGNIGNISTQKLLNEEMDLWKYNFIYEMMHDVAKLITLPIYEQ